MATSFKFFQCQKGHFIQFRTKNRNKTTCSLFAEFYDTWQVYSLTEKLMLYKILFGKKNRKITYTWILTGIVGLAFCFFDNSSSYKWFHFCREPLISFSKPKKGRRSGLQNFIVFVDFSTVLAFFREKIVWRSMLEYFSEIENHRESRLRTG